MIDGKECVRINRQELCFFLKLYKMRGYLSDLLMFKHKIDDFKYTLPHAEPSSKATTSATAPP
jgi:hypothetical protein